MADHIRGRQYEDGRLAAPPPGETTRLEFPAGQTASERVKAILEAWGFDTSAPVVPIDLQAPARLVEVDFRCDPDDGIGRTLELREALARQEGRDA